MYDAGAYVPTAHRHAIRSTALKASARVWTAAMESAESPLSDAWGHPDADLLATPRKAVTPLGSLRHRTPSRWRDYSGPVDSSVWEYVFGKSGKSFALTRLEASE